MKATNEVVLREIAGEYLLIPTGQTALKIHGMITLSESGLLLWKKLQKDCTEEELIETILSEYEVDRETARADVQAFLGQMNEVGILV
ncbi:PqqD family protein [Dysosmobacter sp.]